MNYVWVVGIALIITAFYGLISEYIKARRDKDTYRILLEHEHEHYLEMFNTIYETVQETNDEGILVCKRKIRENIKHLFPGLRPEILICYLRKEDIIIPQEDI
jgi:hypothetical protein